MAEIAAGAIAMGLGGYLAARTDAEHYAGEYAREQREMTTMPAQERAEVAMIFTGYGLQGRVLDTVVDAIAVDRQRWAD